MKNWMIEKCGCGHSACDKYLLSFAGADGRMEKEDAILAAAAPKLLEALEKLIIMQWHIEFSTPPSKSEQDKVWSQAREAIAKTTENGPPAAKHEGP